MENYNPETGEPVGYNYNLSKNMKTDPRHPKLNISVVYDPVMYAYLLEREIAEYEARLRKQNEYILNNNIVKNKGIKNENLSHDNISLVKADSFEQKRPEKNNEKDDNGRKSPNIEPQRTESISISKDNVEKRNSSTVQQKPENCNESKDNGKEPGSSIEQQRQESNNESKDNGKKRCSSIPANSTPKKNKPLDTTIGKETFTKDSDHKKLDSIYEKEKMLKQISNNEKDKLRKELKFKKLQEIKKSPGLSENTKRLLENKQSDNRSVFERLSTNVKKKSPNKSESVEDENFENITDKSETKNFKNTDFSKWHKSNTFWHQFKEFKIDRLRQHEAIERRHDEDMTFQPKINENSKLLLKNRDNTLPTHERLNSCSSLKERKIRALCDKYTPSFSPSINKKKVVNNNSSLQSNSFIADYSPHRDNKSVCYDEKYSNVDYEKNSLKGERKIGLSSNVSGDLYSMNVKENLAWNFSEIGSVAHGGASSEILDNFIDH
jgi:hypothetical protein